MNFSAYLAKNQPLVYRTFSNAMSNGKLAHAYLLSGENGTPLLETAIYLAKTIFCEHPSPLADDECRYCKRVDHRTMNGLRIIGENEGTIKKEEIEDLVSVFSKTSLEETKDCVYIINNVENMTAEAVNSLLKFLEEPPAYVHAFLTTKNIAKVLPTIISRCETMRLLLAPRSEVIKEAISQGINEEDAELASFFINSASLLPPFLKSDEYSLAKESAIRFLTAIPLGSDRLYMCVSKDIAPLLNDKKTAKMLFDVLCLFFKEALLLREKSPLSLQSYVKIIEPIERLKALEKSLLEIMKTRNTLDLNISSGILLEHLAYYLTKENDL